MFSMHDYINLLHLNVAKTEFLQLWKVKALQDAGIYICNY